VVAFVVVGILPLTSLSAPIASALILGRKFGTFKKAEEPPPFYLPFTVNAILSNWTFSLLLAISLVLPFR